MKLKIVSLVGVTHTTLAITRILCLTHIQLVWNFVKLTQIWFTTIFLAFALNGLLFSSAGHVRFNFRSFTSLRDIWWKKKLRGKIFGYLYFSEELNPTSNIILLFGKKDRKKLAIQRFTFYEMFLINGIMLLALT